MFECMVKYIVLDVKEDLAVYGWENMHYTLCFSIDNLLWPSVFQDTLLNISRSNIIW